MAPAQPSAARNASTLFYGISDLQVRDHGRNELLRVADGLADNLNVHGGFARRTGALAIDSVLAHQDQRVGEDIHRDGQLPARFPHHELVLIELFTTLFEYAHALLYGNQNRAVTVRERWKGRPILANRSLTVTALRWVSSGTALSSL